MGSLASAVNENSIAITTSITGSIGRTMSLSSSLPSGTPTAVGSTAAGIKKYINLQLQLPSTPSYIHFTNVPPAIVRRSSDHPIEIFGVKGARICYGESLRDLIIKLVQKPHEVAHCAFTKELLDQTFSMHLKRELRLTGAARATSGDISKEPDASFEPRRPPPGRSEEWPAVVIESGYSESTAHLRAMADLWISKSGGDVKVAIIISIERQRGKIIVEKWIPNATPRGNGPFLRNRGQHARCEKEVIITRNDNGSAAVSGAPLVIRFEEMFLRAPNPPHEKDYVLSRGDFESIAQDIWEVMGWAAPAH
ncbi:hypothetical protein BDW59DRAFT_181288 [Aspergillus cavernicola]|uniref:Uncharacterized protein n=1 Tax=Aspergillus cavernicola TaxID=176166 RepID=A0ABR4I348_9EURO